MYYLSVESCVSGNGLQLDFYKLLHNEKPIDVRNKRLSIAKGLHVCSSSGKGTIESIKCIASMPHQIGNLSSTP